MKLSGIQRYFVVFLVIGLALCAVGALPVPALSSYLRGLLIGTGTGCILPVVVARLLPRWFRENMGEEFESPASHRYRKQIMPAMMCYLLLVVASMGLLHSSALISTAWRAAVAVLPVIPLLFFFYYFLHHINEVDELKRRMQLESIAIGAMLLCCLYLPAAFLQMAKVIAIPADAALFYVFPLLAIGYGIGKFITLRRYR